MKYRFFYFWDAQNPEKTNLRQARKVVGPKAPGALRAHGPKPLGPIGPTFRRTITVTGKVQFLEGP